jgi:O-antigen ligase
MRRRERCTPAALPVTTHRGSRYIRTTAASAADPDTWERHPLASPVVRDERSAARAVFVVATAALLALTSGPLFRVRTWWGFKDPLGRDAVVVTVHAAFGVLALVWLVAGERWRRLDRRGLVVAGALVVWITLSALWSLDRGETFRHGLQLASALAVGAAAAVALGARRFGWALWTALHIGLGWSIVAIYLDRPGTLDRNGDWAGIYFNRNSLALYAALGILVSAFLCVQRYRGAWRLAPVVLALAIVGDLRLIAGSDALTPLVALAGAAAAVVLVVVARRVVARGVAVTRVVAWAGIGAVVVVVVGWLTRDVWLDAAGRDSDLTGRADLWEVAFDWAWRRPVNGFGYLGPWSDREFLADIEAARGTLLGSAHNSFVEVFLGAGVVGLVLLVGLVVVLYLRTARAAVSGRSLVATFPLALLVFVVVENLTETLFVGNQLAVALLGALLAIPPATRR